MFTALGNILLLENLNITLNDVSVNVKTNKYAIPETLIKEVFFSVKIVIFKFIPSKKIENTTFY